MFTNLVAFHVSAIQVQMRTAMGNSASVQAEHKNTKILLLKCHSALGSVNCNRDMVLVTKCTFGSGNGES